MDKEVNNQRIRISSPAFGASRDSQICDPVTGFQREDGTGSHRVNTHWIGKTSI